MALVALRAVGLPILITCISCSKPQAPLADDNTLTYVQGSSVLEVRFSKVDDTHFSAEVRRRGRDGTFALAKGLIEGTQEASVVVDRRLRTQSGSVLEVNVLGPMWVAPDQIKVGGKAQEGSIDRVGAVKSWRRWIVGEVKASFGVGKALRGTWYYEKKTGFLVGMHRASIVDPKGALYVLQSSTVPGLMP